MNIRCKHLLTIPNESLHRWRNALVVVRLFELVNGKRKRERKGERKPVGMAKDFDFQMLVILCHVRVNCSARMHSNDK